MGGRLRGECGDRVDLDQLAFISENGHPEKGARWPVGRELRRDRIPCGTKVVLPPNHVDGGLDEVLRTGSVVVQNCQQIVDCVFRLPAEISNCDYRSVAAKGTSTGSEQNRSRGCDGSICVGNFGKLLVGHSYILMESEPCCRHVVRVFLAPIRAQSAPRSNRDPEM